MSTTTPDTLLTLGQAAALAGVHRTTVVYWVHTGRLPAVTLPPGGRRRGVWRYVRAADLTRLVGGEEGTKNHQREECDEQS